MSDVIFGWIFGIIGSVFALIGIAYLTLRIKGIRQKAEQERIWKLVDGFHKTLTATEVSHYLKLPDRQARMQWLMEEHEEFFNSSHNFIAHNRTGYNPILNTRDLKKSPSLAEKNVTYFLDVRLLKDAYLYRDNASARCDSYSAHMSLTDYQKEIDRDNQITRENQARDLRIRKENQAKEKAKKEASKALWNSMTPAEQRKFRAASGPAARKKLIAAKTAQNDTGYHVDYMYPVIMASYFGNINSNTSHSIDQCGSSSSSYSGGSNSSSSYDGGSSYSSYDSGSSSSYDSGSSSCSFD